MRRGRSLSLSPARTRGSDGPPAAVRQTFSTFRCRTGRLLASAFWRAGLVAAVGSRRCVAGCSAAAPSLCQPCTILLALHCFPIWTSRHSRHPRNTMPPANHSSPLHESGWRKWRALRRLDRDPPMSPCVFASQWGARRPAPGPGRCSHGLLSQYLGHQNIRAIGAVVEASCACGERLGLTREFPARRAQPAALHTRLWVSCTTTPYCCCAFRPESREQLVL
jgi:hypothetical protein